MKELSVKEKAKRYDEAIETARKINSGDGVKAPPDWTTCEVIFPELKESEDEKIRKALINYFRCVAKNGDTVWTNLDYDKVLAWLEKQAEQKSAWSKGDEYYYGIIKYILNNECVGKVDKENVINWFNSLKNKVQPQPKQNLM